MKISYVPGVLLAVSLLSVARDVQAECTWGQAIHDALQARDAVVATLLAFHNNRNLDTAIDLMLSLDELPEQISNLDDLEMSREEDEQLVKVLLKQPAEPIVKDLLKFENKALEKAYKERGLGAMIKTFQEYQNFLCIQSLYSPSGSYAGHELPLDLMCHPIITDLETTPNPFSTNKVCISVSQCSWAQQSNDPFWFSQGTSVEKACAGTKCNVDEAVPIMLSLLWYKVSHFISRSLCYNHLPTLTLKSLIPNELQSINTMVASLKAYTSTLTWEWFFNRALDTRGFSDLDTAMSLVSQHENSFFASIRACHDLDAKNVCIIEQIYAEYVALKEMKKQTHGPKQVRDLRRFPRINHAKLIDLRKNVLKEIDNLAMLLNARMRTESFSQGVSEYFRGLSRFDEKIAEQDIAYIKVKLEDFHRNAGKCSSELEENINSLFNTALYGFTLDGMFNIAEAVNPLGLFKNPGSKYEIAVKMAKTAHGIAKGNLAMYKLSEVIRDTAKLSSDFYNNQAQIPSMEDIVNKIQANNVAGVSELAQDFIKAYGNYNPKVNRNRLAHNDAMWGAFKDSACDLLSQVDVAGKSLTIKEEIRQTCENLEGTLAQFFTLRENIFDFQFELVDKVAELMRGSIGRTDVMKPSKYIYQLENKQELFLGFFKTQNRLQTEASTYCNKLEYMNQGEAISVCKQKDSGLFSEADLDDLVAYNPQINYHLEERFVYIPTRPQFSGDQGFIDLRRLKRGSVTFQPPSNATWLRQFNWLASNETKVPFVESFKLYLPRKSFAVSYLKTQVTLSSKAGSRVSLSSDVNYNLPLESTRYVTKYIEKYVRCPSGRNIANPYSLCENLPKLCETTQRMPGTSMMPTILTTWELRYTMKSGLSNADHVWDTPDPTTNLLVIGKVKLRYLPSAALSKKSNVMTAESNPRLGCCTGNMYRPKWNDIECVTCPSVVPSTSKLDGYYCEVQK